MIERNKINFFYLLGYYISLTLWVMGPGQVGALGRCPSCPGPGPGLKETLHVPNKGSKKFINKGKSAFVNPAYALVPFKEDLGEHFVVAIGCVSTLVVQGLKVKIFFK